MAENKKNITTKVDFKLTEKQFNIYAWLKEQNLNTDEDTLNYWSRMYSAERIYDVVNFAKARIMEGQKIRNIGGWIHKFLVTELPVSNDLCKKNQKNALKFIQKNNWKSVKVYEKYLKDEITGDDLPLTIPQDTFERALEALFQKSQMYGNC